MTRIGRQIPNFTYPNVAPEQLLLGIGAAWLDPWRRGPERDRQRRGDRNAVLPRLFFGDPDEVVAQVRELLVVGLDGVVVNMMSDGSDPDAVWLAGETLTRAFNR